MSERQAVVLRAVVTSYVGDASPVGSATLTNLVPLRLSAASIRNTLADLAELGFVQKPHASSGRIPTEAGFRHYVDELLDPRDLGRYEKRSLADRLQDLTPGAWPLRTSELLSDATRLLGFVLRPRIEHLRLRHVSLVQLSVERVLAILVSEDGTSHSRVVEAPSQGGQVRLERMARLLNERLAGKTLSEVRALVDAELERLRTRADQLVSEALRLAREALGSEAGGPEDLVVATRLALLEQPEFREDPDRLREIFRAIEDQEGLLAMLDELFPGEGVTVKFGAEVAEPALRSCAVVVAPYGGSAGPGGFLGVIGPRRMDYGRVLPLVDYLSHLVTEKLGE